MKTPSSFLNVHWPVILLVVVSLILHFTWLTSPAEVVFDEVHFGKFVSSYCCTHQRIFDIHPPHAKLLIAAAVGITGYNGSFPFDHIGQPFTDDVPVLAFRFVPALFGSLLPLLVYVLLRQLVVSRQFSLLGGVAMLLDNALLLQTRIIALDGILLVATFGALSLALAAQKHTRYAYYYWIGAGILAGLAVGIKFTGLLVLGILFLMLFRRWWQRPTTVVLRESLLVGAILLVSATVIYIGGWYLHFALLDQPGTGDVWQIPTGNFWPDLIKIHQNMLSANYYLSGTHPYSSQWWSWPIMLRPVFYWQEGTALLYFFGNPAVWWGILIGLVWILITTFHDRGFRREMRQWIGKVGWVVLAGYIFSFAPLINVPRVLFLYHYSTPLIFSLLFVVVGVDMWATQPLNRNRILGVAVAAIVIAFIIFSPLTFGFALPLSLQQSLFWLPTWR